MSTSRSQNFEDAQNKSWDIVGMALTGGIALAGIIGTHKFIKSSPTDTLNRVGGVGLVDNAITSQKSTHTPSSPNLKFTSNAINSAYTTHSIDPFIDEFGVPRFGKNKYNNKRGSNLELGKRAVSSEEILERLAKPKNNSLDILKGSFGMKDINLPNSNIAIKSDILKSYTNPTKDIIVTREVTNASTSKSSLARNTFQVHKLGTMSHRSYTLPSLPSTPIKEDSAVASLSYLSDKAKNILKAEITKMRSVSGASVIDHLGSKAILPGVILSARKKGIKVGSFSTFVDTVTQHLLSNLKDVKEAYSTKLIGNGTTNGTVKLTDEAAINTIIKEISDFSSRAVRFSSDQTAGLSYQQTSAVLDISQSRMLGKSKLFKALYNSEFFKKHKITDRDLYSPLLGKTLGKPMKPTPQMMEHLIYTGYELPELEKSSGLFQSSINTAGLAEGFLSSAAPYKILPFAYMQKTVRRVDELTQLGLSSSITGISSTGYNALYNVRKSSFLLQGSRFQTPYTLNDLSSSIKSSGLKEGRVGVTGLSFNTVAFDESEKGISEMRYLAEKYNLSEKDFQKAIQRSKEFALNLDQGQVYIGGALSGKQRKDLANVMAIYNKSSYTLKSRSKIGQNFTMPFADGKTETLAQKLLHGVRSVDDNLANVSDQKLYTQILSGKYNKIINDLGIHSKKNDILIYEKSIDNKFTPIRIDKAGKITSFEQVIYSKDADYTKGVKVNILEKRALRTGDAIGTEITGHAIAETNLAKSTGKVQVATRSGEVALNPLIIQAQDTLREQGRFISEVVSKPVYGFDYFRSELSKIKIDGLSENALDTLATEYAPKYLSNTKTRLSRVLKVLKPIIGESVVTGLGSEISAAGSVEEAMGILMSAPNTKKLGKLMASKSTAVADTILNLQSFQQDALGEQLGVIAKIKNKILNGGKTLSKNNTKLLIKQLDTVSERILRAQQIYTPEDIEAGAGAMLSFDPKTKTFIRGTLGFTHVAAKSTSILDKVSNTGEAGVYDSMRSSKITMDIAMGLMMQTRDVGKRLEVFKKATDIIVTGSRLKGMAVDNIALLHTMAASTDHIYDTIKRASKRDIKEIAPGLLNIAETKKEFSQLLKSGEWDKIRDWTANAIRYGADPNEVELPDVLEDVLNKAFIFDVRGKNVVAKELGGTVPLSEIYIGNISTQPIGTDELDKTFLGKANKAKLDVINTIIKGGTGEEIQESLGIMHKVFNSMETTKTGLLNVLQFGVNFGGGGYMRSVSSRSVEASLRSKYEGVGNRSLGENSLALFTKNKKTETFVPIDKRMTTLISGRAIGSSKDETVEHILQRATQTDTPETAVEKVYAYDPKTNKYVSVGSSQYGIEVRYPNTNVKTNVMAQRQLVIHDTTRIADEPFEDILGRVGLRQMYNNPDVAYVDSVIQAMMDGDLDGDARAMLNLDYIEIMQEMDQSVTNGMKERTGLFQEQMKEQVNRYINSGYYARYKEQLLNKLSGSMKIPEYIVAGGGLSLAANVMERFTQAQGKTLQKQWTGIITQRTKDNFDVVRDLLTESFNKPNSKVTSTDINGILDIVGNDLLHFNGLTGEEKGLMTSIFKDPEKYAINDFGSLFFESVAGVQHTAIKSSIAKGFSNMPLLASLSEITSTNPDTYQRSLNTWQLLSEVSSIWDSGKATEEFKLRKSNEIANAIQSILRGFKANASKDDTERYARLYTDKSLEPLFKESKVKDLASAIYSGLEKSTAAPAEQMSAILNTLDPKQAELLASSLSKITVGLKKAIDVVDRNADLPGGFGRLFSESKNFGKMSMIHLLAYAASETNSPKDLSLHTLLNVSGLAQQDVSTIVTNIKEALSESNKKLENSPKNTKEEQLLQDTIDNSKIGPNVFDDLLRIGSTAKASAKAGLRSLFVEKSSKNAAEKAKDIAFSKLKTELKDFASSGKGSKFMLFGGVALSLLGTSHIISALNHQNIDLPQEAPLPRNIPLDDLKYEPAVFDTSPEQSVRVTQGNELPARMDIMSEYAQAEDPSSFIASLKNQASIGVGSTIIDQHNSYGRTEYNDYRRTSANSRF